MTLEISWSRAAITQTGKRRPSTERDASCQEEGGQTICSWLWD